MKRRPRSQRRLGSTQEKKRIRLRRRRQTLPTPNQGEELASASTPEREGGRSYREGRTNGILCLAEKEVETDDIGTRTKNKPLRLPPWHEEPSN